MRLSGCGSDGCCKGENFVSCRIAILKFIPGGGCGGASGGGDVLVDVVVVAEGFWWWWWQSGGSGGGDSLCKGSSCNSCRSAIVKCMLCGGGGGGDGCDVAVMVVGVGKTRENTTTINTTRAPQRWDRSQPI